MSALKHRVPSNIVRCIVFVVFCGLVPAATAHAAPESTIVEAEILEVSQYPNAQKLDYPNCLISAKIRVHQIISGPATPEHCEALFMWYRDGKIDRRLTNVLKPAAKMELKLIDFDQAPGSVRETNQANDFLDLNSSQYYAVGIKRKDEFSPVLAPQKFKDRNGYVSLMEHSLNPPRPPEVWHNRQCRLKQKQAKITAILSNGAAIPRIKCEEALIAAKIPYHIVPIHGRNIAFIYYPGSNSLFCLPTQAGLQENHRTVKNYAGIKSLNEFLLRNQIELMIVLIPDKERVAKRIVFPRMRNIPDRQYYEVAQDLLNNGIEPVMLYPQVLDRWRDFNLLYEYRWNDYHPAFGAAEVAGLACADLCKAEGIENRTAKKEFTEQSHVEKYSDWIKDFTGDKTVSYPLVLHRGKNITLDAPDSPILILGNSFARSPRQGASIGHRLAFYTGIIPDLLKCEGSGMATIIPKRLLLNGERYLRGKKICFLIMHVSFFQYPWADIQAYDKIYSLISAGHDSLEIPPEQIKITGAVESSSPDKKLQWQLNYHKEVLPRSWRIFVSPKSDTQRNKLICSLPDGTCRNTPCLISISAYSSQIMKVTVGSKSEILYANRDNLMFELPPNINSFTLEVSPDQVCALGPVKIFYDNRR